MIACGEQTQIEMTSSEIMEQLLQNAEAVNGFILESTERIAFDSDEALTINIEAKHYVTEAGEDEHLESVVYKEEYHDSDDPSAISLPTYSHERHFRNGYLYDISVPFRNPLRYPITEPQNHLLIHYIENAWSMDVENNQSFNFSDMDYQITFPIYSNWQVDSLYFKHIPNMIETIDGTITYLFDSAFRITEIRVEGSLLFEENFYEIETASYMQTISLIQTDDVVFDFPDWIDDSSAWSDYDSWHITVESILGTWETEDELESMTFNEDHTGYRKVGDEITNFLYSIEGHSFLAISTENAEEELWEMVLWNVGYLDLRSSLSSEDNIRYRRDDYECENCLTDEEFEEFFDDIFGDWIQN